MMHATDVIAHLVVAVAAHVRGDGAPPHLQAVLACIRSWHALDAVQSLQLSIHTNNGAAIAALLARRGTSERLPAGLRMRVISWTGNKAFMLAHAHLHEWAAIVAAEQRSLVTAFIHLEDDVCPSAEALRSWADDDALLHESGAAGAGFQRGFYRWEATRLPHQMSQQQAVHGKYNDAYVHARAAAWRARANASLGERFVLDERQRRRFRPPAPLTCASPTPCAVSSPVGQHTRPPQWCAAFPSVAVLSPRSRAFISFANPYSAITAARRSLVEKFLLHSRGWNLSTPSVLHLAPSSDPRSATDYAASVHRSTGPATRALIQAMDDSIHSTRTRADAAHWPRGSFRTRHKA